MTKASEYLYFVQNLDVNMITLSAGGLFLLLLLWRKRKSLYATSSIPTNTKYGRSLPGLGRWPSSIDFLFRGPEILDRGYKKMGKSPFVVPTPENYLVLVSSKEHVKEILEAPESDLSLQAVVNDIFRPQYTMDGFMIQHDVSTTRSIAHRVLRTLLTSNLPILQPALQSRIAEAFSSEFQSSCFADGTEWKAIPTFAMARKLIVKVNSFAFVGERLSANPEYLKAAIQFPEDAFVSAEVLQITPDLLAPLVAAIMTRNNRAIKDLRKYLVPLIEGRIAEQSDAESQKDKPLDCLQWIINSSPRKNPWTTEQIIHEFLALWFGSVHQMAMSLVYTLNDVCTHHQYIEPLRTEVQEQAKRNWELGSLDGLPRLDSFLKESARLNPSDAISLRRKALRPVTLADGTHIPTGNWLCTPQKAIMRDAENYSKPLHFDGYRFVTANEEGKSAPKDSLFTKVEESFPFWGMGQHACPGRFFASGMLKLMVAHVLLTYDIRFADESQKRTFCWRSAIVPSSKSAILFRERHA